MSENLIQRWLDNGDERAAEALYQAHHKRVFRLAYALLGNTGDAEAVMQDTMVSALTGIKSYETERSSFTTWLHTITVSACRARQRRQSPLQASTGGRGESAGDMANQASGPKEGTIASESRNELGQTLKQLSPKLREAIVLRYWSGHTYQEMADILRCPVPTAQSRVRLAYEQLRKLSDPIGEPALGGEILR